MFVLRKECLRSLKNRIPIRDKARERKEDKDAGLRVRAYEG